MHARLKGFSIIELMVAMTISLILLAGVLAVVYSSKVSYNENERLGRIQENGRAALELVLRDLRGAGFPGCAQPIKDLFQINNVLSTPTGLLWNLAQPVYGYEAGASAWTPALDTTVIPSATTGNDVVVVRSVRANSPSFPTTKFVNPTDDIEVSKDPSETIAAGTPMVISDCAGASIFVATGVTESAGGTKMTLVHGTGGAPTNADNDLKNVFTGGARVAPIVTIIYYIRPSAAGGPALWRVVSGGGPEEVIQGVEAMQIRYGVDTDGDSLVNSYVDASAVTNWSNVICVSVAMLVRSIEQNAATKDTRTYSLLQKTVGPFGDRFQRSIFSTTVTLRNRTT